MDGVTKQNVSWTCKRDIMLDLANNRNSYEVYNWDYNDDLEWSG